MRKKYVFRGRPFFDGWGGRVRSKVVEDRGGYDYAKAEIHKQGTYLTRGQGWSVYLVLTPLRSNTRECVRTGNVGSLEASNSPLIRVEYVKLCVLPVQGSSTISQSQD